MAMFIYFIVTLTNEPKLMHVLLRIARVLKLGTGPLTVVKCLAASYPYILVMRLFDVENYKSNAYVLCFVCDQILQCNIQN